MGAGTAKRMLEAQQAAAVRKLEVEKAKREAAVSQAIKEEQAVAKLAQLALAVKDKVSRFVGTEAPVQRLLSNMAGTCDKETVGFLLGVVAKAVEEEDTEDNRMVRVSLGLLGRANNQGPLIILTAENSRPEVHMGAVQQWFRTASPQQREGKPFLLPKPTGGGPQRVAMHMDSVTDPTFINNLQTNSRVEIQGSFFEVSFEYHQNRTVTLIPDKCSEDQFRCFMSILQAGGFSRAEIEFILANQARESLRCSALNGPELSARAREIVAVQFQTQGPRGGPGLSPAAWTSSKDPRSVPRIFLVLKTEGARDLFLQLAVTMKVVFFLGTSPKTEDCVLRGLLNVEARELRRSISDLTGS